MSSQEGVWTETIWRTEFKVTETKLSLAGDHHAGATTTNDSSTRFELGSK